MRESRAARVSRLGGLVATAILRAAVSQTLETINAREVVKWFESES